MPSRERPSYLPSLLREGYNSVTRNPLVSTAAALAIIAAMLVLGVFIIFSYNVYALTTFAQEDLEIRIFLKEGVTEEQKGAIYNSLVENPKVKSVTFESKEEALENFADDLSEYSELLNDYQGDNNPLPESFNVQAYNLEDLSEIRDQVEKYEDEVEYVRYQEDLINTLKRFTTFMNIFSIVLLFIISIIALFLIYNTIRLTVASRRREIEIMRDVGATNSYIRTPFVLCGSFIGLISAFVSVMIVCTVYYYAIGFINGSLLFTLQNALVSPGHIIIVLLISFIAYGLLIGSLGAAIATHKYLNV